MGKLDTQKEMESWIVKNSTEMELLAAQEKEFVFASIYDDGEAIVVLNDDAEKKLNIQVLDVFDEVSGADAGLGEAKGTDVVRICQEVCKERMAKMGEEVDSILLVITQEEGKQLLVAKEDGQGIMVREFDVYQSQRVSGRLNVFQ